MSLQTKISALITAIGADIKQIKSDIVAQGFQRFTTGRYYTPRGSSSTTPLAEGQPIAIPFIVSQAKTFDKIGIECTTAGSQGTGTGPPVVRLAICADDGNGTPDARVLDAGTVIGTSTTPQEITISQALAVGLYWLVATCQGGAQTRPSIRVVTGSSPTTSPAVGAPSLALATTSGGGSGVAGAVGSVPGAFPANFPKPLVTTQVFAGPLIALRAA